ncbi:hypothetical protein OIV83_002397 [Microbotryomycetes sp. JL201]|nr:hypothetical protein OIV83_002397 [Microbotryomycetes sp. JL201]
MHSATVIALGFALAAQAASAVATHSHHAGSVSHLAARDLKLAPHAVFQPVVRRARASKLDRPRRLSKRASANEATLKCLSAYTFALCDGDACTDMGSVAAGTMCKDNAIAFDTGYEESSDNSSDVSTTAQIKDEQVQAAAATVSVKQLNLVLAASSSSAAPAAATTTAGDDDWICDEEEETWTDDSSSTGTATAAPSAATVAENWVQTTTSTTTSTTTTTEAPAATSDSGTNGNTGSGESYSGKATFYYQYGVAGSCGTANPDSAYIVAMNAPMANGGSHCGQTVHITNTANGKSVDATVADLCPGCSWGDLDLSVAAFDAIGAQESGVLPITWSFTS